MSRRTTTKRRQNSGIGSLMLSFVMFILGYLVASFFDMSQLSHWMTARFSGQSAALQPGAVKTADLPKPKFEFYTLLTKDQVVDPATATMAQPTTANAAQMTNTTKTEQNGNEAARPATLAVAPKSEKAPLDLTVTQKLPLHAPLVASIPAQPQYRATPVVADKGRYIIQVGSFRNQREAEKLKAALAMRGFSSVITSSAQQQVVWYRVFIGPFSSLSDAQRVHHEFAVRDRISGMIRKLDV